MPAPQPTAAPGLPVPVSGIELLRNPARLAAAFELLNRLSQLQVQVGPASTKGQQSLQHSAEAIVLSLPLQFSRPIEDSDGTTAGNAAQLNLILAELRRVKMLPAS